MGKGDVCQLLSGQVLLGVIVVGWSEPRTAVCLLPGVHYVSVPVLACLLLGHVLAANC
jgi:hypothetical protein